MRRECNLLELDQIVKLIVPDDVRSGADFCSLTQILGEHGDLHQELDATNSPITYHAPLAETCQKGR